MLCRLILIFCVIFSLSYATKYGNVKIWDGTDELNINSDSSITVRVDSTVPTRDTDLRAHELEIARRNIPGMAYIHKYGDNPDIDISSGYEAVWTYGGQYNFLSTGEIHNIHSTSAEDSGVIISSGTLTACAPNFICDTSATFVSDSVIPGDIFVNISDASIGQVFSVVSDTQLYISDMLEVESGRPGADNATGDSYMIVRPAKTGAAMMYVRGLSLYGNEELYNIVVLQGLDTVQTDTAFWRIYRMGIINAGTAKKAVGAIRARASISGTVSAEIVDSANQTLMAVYTIPGSKYGYIRGWWCALSSKKTGYCGVNLRLGPGSGATFVLQRRTINTDGNSSFYFEYNPPLFIPSLIDIFIEANADVDNMGVSGGFDILLIDK